MREITQIAKRGTGQKIGTNSMAQTQKNLTQRQRVFADLFVISLDVKKAAKEAGYKDWTRAGYKVKAYPHVAAYIAAELARKTEKAQVDESYVISTIVEVMERGKQARPVLNRDGTPVIIENENGDLVPAYTFDAGAVLRGADMLAKKLNLYKTHDDAKKEDELDDMRRLMDEIADRAEPIPVVRNPMSFAEFERRSRADRTSVIEDAEEADGIAAE